MSKKSGEWGKLPIPSDWNEATDGYQLVALCIPNSRQWRAILVGQITDLAYGRKWNKHTGTIKEVQKLAGEIFETMAITCLDDISVAIECICSATGVLAEKSGQEGQAAEGSLSDGTIETGEGEQFPDQEAYFNAKCNASNAVFDTILGMVTWLKENDVDMLAGVFGGITSGLLVAAALAGPVGWAWALVSSLVVSLAGFVVAYALSFIDLEDALNDVHEACVMALYNATDAITAEANFIAAVEAGTPTITSIEALFLGLLLSAEVVNQLFSPREDVANYESSSPIDCGDSLLAFWTFPTDEEGWTFRDDSDSPSSASGAYNSVDEALEVTMVNTGGGSQPRAKGTWLKTGLSVLVTPGSSAQFDYSASSDGVVTSPWLRVIYSDASEDLLIKPGTTTAGTVVLTLPAAKTIAEIECSFSRKWSLSGTHNSDVLEVRVYGT